MSATDVLATLADGAVHSGADLARHQGLSRTAIWKQVATLEKLGIKVTRVRGQGYQIEGGLDLLDEQRIRDAIDTDASTWLHDLQIHQSIDSTNAELRRQTPFGRRASVCLAESQSAGRGRRGRSWVSPFASSIYLSVGWQFRGGAEVLEGLSLAIGVAVGEALGELGVDSIALKWPNDIYLDGKKLAGILVEMSGDFSGPCDVVVGIGINVQLPDGAAEGIEQPWADLRDSGQGAFTRSVLVGKLLSHLLPALATYEEHGFAPWRERWLAMDAFAGRPVIVDNNGRRLSGTAAGVDARGALLLSTGAGVQSIYGGEVSLRLQEAAQ
ncbi:bifunctional biotin--[acetyl-CoA-carboxylase] ligase/biotin operon repressor BirA [Congregibacter litoralis]|uniref:Bifunctional ligase/repressor BirA n=1 Tax=Congregibacter litoralis KT71 TaxID=314285 RepID=A4A6B6_9GAMM|nr:bifunctional biotin--[acetyl-CoA-carboxylase] ligase/biotin operon repressor BirA [Congregibacter litoralis]EAQ98563.1 birA, biotin-[acetyl-CoA-carboxylase] ligase region [Congregibacter litoralis KT71]